MTFLAAVDALLSLESMKFPVFSLLTGNSGLRETSSQLTPPSSGESVANSKRHVVTVTTGLLVGALRALIGAGGSESRSRQANGTSSRSLENVLASAERPDGASGNRKFESTSLRR
jgi:hypothetical protein